MKESINLYIADDHQIFIDGLTLLLKSENNLNIIGAAINGQKAYEDILSLKPDIALLDLRMPGKDGLEILQSLLLKTNTRVIILSMTLEKRKLMDAMNYNAYAYLHKNVGKQELLDTIYKVANGEKLINNNKLLLEKGTKTFLSERETDVLKLVLKGQTSSQIAEQLNLSIFTVSTHRKNITKKTKANNIDNLIKWAVDNNIVQDF
jgi:DNA-binding NarL/FixJ family response regulator